MFGERLVSHLPILMNEDHFESQIFHISFWVICLMMWSPSSLIQLACFFQGFREYMSRIWNTSLPRMYLKAIIVCFQYRFDHLWPVLAIFGNPCMGLVSSPFPPFSRWWFQIFFWFSPLSGEMIQIDYFFSDGLKPPPQFFCLALGGFDISIAESSSTCSSRVVDVNPSFSISQGGLGGWLGKVVWKI